MRRGSIFLPQGAVTGIGSLPLTDAQWDTKSLQRADLPRQVGALSMSGHSHVHSRSLDHSWRRFPLLLRSDHRLRPYSLNLLPSLYGFFYEEPHLTHQFGERYQNYLRTIPRWLPRLPTHTRPSTNEWKKPDRERHDLRHTSQIPMMGVKFPRFGSVDDCP